jgi:hypothetical protein
VYTKETEFKEPKPELNSFLNALLIDLLQPLESSGLPGNSLERARKYLTDQIESGGLVRYHGVPNAPGIGTLGCVITPDADDTALVWRLAPGDPRMRSTALATLKQYRTDEGLYRTWLAPRDAYQCINPGRDPNPTDVAIQLHVLLLLAKAEPPAARALCTSLKPLINEDRIWVYYNNAPLVPIMRLKDLKEAGCELELSQSRLTTSMPGQEPWVRIASLLAGKKSLARVDAETLLRQIANNNFSFVRRNPPLLYHNDLTASVSRYYWSEDAGYALWLRLYYEHEHVRSSKANR